MQHRRVRTIIWVMWHATLPKSCKSFLALSLAVSVASGVPCLGRFHPRSTGRVLLFAAEDAPPVVRQRLEGICLATELRLAQLDIQVITAPTLRLDSASDRNRLDNTIEQLRPRLLILDPFVRLHSRDENASSEVAPLLGFLRELQRRYQLAVLVVHHARKGAHRLRAGQALRGSSEFHAWGDSNLYLRRPKEQLLLSIEHRAAASPTDIPVALQGQPGELSLRVVDSPPLAQPDKPSSLIEQILSVLEQAPHPLSFDELRKSCRIRTASLCKALNELKTNGQVQKMNQAYQLVSP